MWQRCGVVIAFAVATLSCSEPPLKEFHQAEGALTAARAADAATYAPETLQAAEAALAKYDTAVTQHDYRQALNAALAARDQAYEAAKEASNKKAEARSRAETLIKQLETLNATGTARLSAANRPTGAAADRLRAALRPVPDAMQEARARMDRQDYTGTAQQLTPVVTALEKELPATRSRR
jgi:hypothetical protein